MLPSLFYCFHLLLVLLPATALSSLYATATPAPTATAMPAATVTATPPSEPTSTPDTSAHPMGCAPDELFVDHQAWYSRPEEDFGHVHVQLCFPHMKTVHGSLPLRVTTILHNNPGTLYQIAVQAGQDSFSTPAILRLRSLGRTLSNCEATGGELRDSGRTCRWTDTLNVNTARAQYDGWTQFRIQAKVRLPDTHEMWTSSGYHAYLANHKTVYDDLYMDPKIAEGRGYYNDNENPGTYANAHIVDPPTGPVSGIWQPYVRLYDGSGVGWPITKHYAALNTDFHNGNKGTIVKEGTGSFRGNLSIDTTKLPNGWHRLFLKAESQNTNTKHISSGILAIWFEVRN